MSRIADETRCDRGGLHRLAWATVLPSGARIVQAHERASGVDGWDIVERVYTSDSLEVDVAALHVTAACPHGREYSVDIAPALRGTGVLAATRLRPVGERFGVSPKRHKRPRDTM